MIYLIEEAVHGSLVAMHRHLRSIIQLRIFYFYLFGDFFIAKHSCFNVLIMETHGVYLAIFNRDVCFHIVPELQNFLCYVGNKMS
jgi:hypothetical protein